MKWTNGYIIEIKSSEAFWPGRESEGEGGEKWSRILHGKRFADGHNCREYSLGNNQDLTRKMKLEEAAS